MTTCIIAEKPSVARDIARIVGANNKQDGYLEGSGYLVTWAMGHLIALAMPEAYGFSAYKAEDLPIRPNPFQLVVRQVRKDKEYVSDPSALKQLKVIRSCFDKADRIIVATDAGREGELIFRYIYQYLDCKKPYDRLWISSLTDKAIREGLSNLKPGNCYDNLYHSAKARSEADWLVGINASRALSIARRGGYSLGRVQTPTLAMVCRRYIENRDFSSVPYWKLSVLTEKEGLSLKAVGCKDYESEASAQTALAALRSQSRLTVESVARRVDEHGRIKVTQSVLTSFYTDTRIVSCYLRRTCLHKPTGKTMFSPFYGHESAHLKLKKGCSSNQLARAASLFTHKVYDFFPRSISTLYG